MKCTITPQHINHKMILLLPEEVSAPLPSRGLVSVVGSVNGTPITRVLEPDGRGSHWFFVDDTLQKAARLAVGKPAEVEVSPVKEWPEPTVPDDLKKALSVDDEARAIWEDISPLARWDWIRWVQSTNSLDTRAIRIEKTLSKMKGGTRQACCFNRSACTEMSVSKQGMLSPGN